MFKEISQNEATLNVQLVTGEQPGGLYSREAKQGGVKIGSTDKHVTEMTTGSSIWVVFIQTTGTLVVLCHIGDSNSVVPNILDISRLARDACMASGLTWSPTH